MCQLGSWSPYRFPSSTRLLLEAPLFHRLVNWAQSFLLRRSSYTFQTCSRTISDVLSLSVCVKNWIVFAPTQNWRCQVLFSFVQRSFRVIFSSKEPLSTFICRDTPFWPTYNCSSYRCTFSYVQAFLHRHGAPTNHHLVFLPYLRCRKKSVDLYSACSVSNCPASDATNLWKLCSNHQANQRNFP